MGNVATQFLWDEADGGKIHINRVQDCEPIIEQAKRLREQPRGKDGLRHVARIPEVIVEQYCNNHGITFAEFMRDNTHVERMLKDPDLSYFRIAP